MKKRISVVILFAVYLLLLTGNSMFAGVGTKGAEFLKFGVGAKPQSLGDAFTGAENDINCIYWNPAGLSKMEEIEVALTYAMLYEGISFTAVNAGKNFENIGFIGIGIMSLSMGSMIGLDKYGNPADDYSAGDMTLNIAYAREINDRISAGGTIKLIQESIADESTSGFALDIGGIYNNAFDKENLTLGAALRNLGSGIGYSETFSLPMNLKIGAKYTLQENLIILGDIGLIELGRNICAGIEYVASEKITVRGGLKTSTMSDLGFSSAVTLGIGLNLDKFVFDYALLPSGDLGITHRISLSMKF